jgi:hypothetical protein
MARQSALIITDVPLPQAVIVENTDDRRYMDQCFTDPIGTRSTCQNGREQCWHSYVVTRTRSSSSQRVCPSSTGRVQRDSQYTHAGVVGTGFRLPAFLNSGRKTKNKTTPRKMNFTVATMRRITRILLTRNLPSLTIHRSPVEGPSHLYRTRRASVRQIWRERKFVPKLGLSAPPHARRAGTFGRMRASRQP